MITDDVLIRDWPGLVRYEDTWQAMRELTDQRTQDSLDQIWLLEHVPVYTQGQNGKAEHVLRANEIPIIQSDRGGQITYHGPGQLVIYTMVDLRRKKWHVRDIVTALEQSVVQFLSDESLIAEARCDAPGVYLNHKKICSVGLRVRRGCTYHGLALNISVDLDPFHHINPCGYHDLKMTNLSTHLPHYNVPMAKAKLVQYLIKNLGYSHAIQNF